MTLVPGDVPQKTSTKRISHTHTQNIVRTPSYWEGEASVSLILKAVSEIRTLLFKNISSKDDKLIPLAMLKDSFPLAEKMSQSINQLRRKLIKPALPPQFSKLAEKSKESSKWLFGDSVSEYVENIEKENKLMSLLKDKKDSGKRKHSEASSDSRFSFKSQKRTPEYGQNF